MRRFVVFLGIFPFLVGCSGAGARALRPVAMVAPDDVPRHSALPIPGWTRMPVHKAAKFINPAWPKLCAAFYREDQGYVLVFVSDRNPEGAATQEVARMLSAGTGTLRREPATRGVNYVWRGRHASEGLHGMIAARAFADSQSILVFGQWRSRANGQATKDFLAFADSPALAAEVGPGAYDPDWTEE